MKVDQIRALSDADLSKELEAAHKELFSLRFRLSTRQLTNHRELPKAKKTIARLKTVMKQRELQAP